jgi:hypothetical protein
MWGEVKKTDIVQQDQPSNHQHANQHPQSAYSFIPGEMLILERHQGHSTETRMN